MKIKIKNAEEDDLKNIATLYVSSLKKAFSKFLLSSTIDKFNIEEKYNFLKNMLQTNTGSIFIAQDLKTKQICSYIIYKNLTQKNIEIISFYISKEYTNEDVGKKMIIHLKNYCKQNYISNIVLWTFKNNSNPINFYKKLGFYETGFQRESKIETGQIEVQYLLKAF